MDRDSAAHFSADVLCLLVVGFLVVAVVVLGFVCLFLCLVWFGLELGCFCFVLFCFLLLFFFWGGEGFFPSLFLSFSLLLKCPSCLSFFLLLVLLLFFFFFFMPRCCGGGDGGERWNGDVEEGGGGGLLICFVAQSRLEILIMRAVPSLFAEAI